MADDSSSADVEKLEMKMTMGFSGKILDNKRTAWLKMQKMALSVLG